ncbi:hypothetical protein [Tychonema sp. LEGE 07203]|uniref:hypothetical protein n=1 Tax=Tychonema sp. LEGE 07203 TaxID=1828671 RepID=UPI00188064EC|nr:hypothetical protein [Tychonema sp. LEGE 07203]MBE9096178.1 hypothetical protein [Tychonema sp. LEGE 07203]
MVQNVNPNGQWYWIEILAGMPMVRATIELIEDLALQYQQDCGIRSRITHFIEIAFSQLSGINELQPLPQLPLQNAPPETHLHSG